MLFARPCDTEKHYHLIFPPADRSCGLAMKNIIVPSVESLAAHEEAAAEITQLRRRGVPCHLEDHPNRNGHHIEIVHDEDTQPKLPPFPVD